MGVYLCDVCRNEHDQRTRKCQRCGSQSVWYTPTAADIREQCEGIQATWSQATERSRRKWACDEEVDFRCPQRQCGRRVMREREPE